MVAEVLKIISMKPLDGLKLEFVFSDNTQKVVDLASGTYMIQPIFDPVRNIPEFFRAVKVYEYGHGVFWPNSANISAAALHQEPATAAELEAAVERARLVREGLRIQDEQAKWYRAYIESVTVQDGFEVVVRFDDGTEKVLDLTPYMTHSIFEPVRNDPDVFRSVGVYGGGQDGSGIGLYWPNGADIMAQILYDEDLDGQTEHQTMLDIIRAA